MQQGFLKRYSSSLIIFLIIFDFITFIMAGCLAYFLKFQFFAPIPTYYNFAIIIGSLIAVVVFISFNMYKPQRGYNFFFLLGQFFACWITIFFLFILCVFLIKKNVLFSREWIILWTLIGFILSCFFHICFFIGLHFLRKHGYNQRHVMIVGAGQLGMQVAKKIRSELWSGFSIKSFYDDDVQKIGKNIDGVPVYAIPDELQVDVLNDDIDEVWICLPLRAESRIKQIMHALRFSTINIRLIPDIFGLNLLNHEINHLVGIPTIILRQTPMKGVNQVIKAFEDRILAALILIIISPIMLIIAAVVKLSSPGPVFYKQRRVSWNGKEFNMLKFRSMRTDAESKSGAVWAVENDPRTTKIGAFLRRTSLDELPQFINVLKGDMSIVGPRPERPEFIHKFKYEVPNYMQKHLVKAGITGWAQIHGWRGNTSLEKRIEYDLNYIENWSLFLDLKIIFLTIFKGFFNKNAY